MNIAQAKQQVKDAVEAYLALDERGRPLLDIARQRPVFLVGAPGIGKTAIMAQIAQELGIGLVSYSMTHHTRQSALGLPLIVHENYEGLEYEASEYTMSEIIASVYAYIKKSGVRQGILFLDEINCVSETLYPSMLQFLQFKTFGRHAVPEGWIIVTAGNPPEYNKSVHEFDIVTLDRVKKVSVEPDFDAWKAYAVSKGTHPAILTFLEIKKHRFYSIEASLEGKSFVTARGWDDLSDIIGVFERLGKPVDFDLIVQYVQSEAIAREFAAYYDLFNKYRDDYRVDEILGGGEIDGIIDRAAEAEFDERLSLVGLLL
ncbi:MAG: AAA family ATPase, partial [Gordonibacter sp.]